MPELSREYSLEDQRAFAALSGDFNPMHLDPLHARREMFGTVIVHGIHSLLNALQDYFRHAQLDGPVDITGLRCDFLQPVFLNVATRLVVEIKATGSVRLRLLDPNNGLLTNISLQWVACGGHARLPSSPTEYASAPDALDIKSAIGLSGALPLGFDPSIAAQRFPELIHWIGEPAFAALLATTRLVGMYCPGLHSIFSGLRLVGTPDTSNALTFKADASDERFSRVLLQVSGGGLSGDLEAFWRPKPVEQLAFSEMQACIERGVAANQTALVLGGSRGLGEATAKLVAAAGGEVILTYHHGREDAERVVGEINGGGASAEAFHCDIANGATLLQALAAKAVAPNALYYFASPKIFNPKVPSFDRAQFDRFSDVYVGGLAELYYAFRSLYPTAHLVIINPSSVAIDVPVKGLAEYASAKAASEVMCANLARFDKNLTVIQRRLPRIRTDQTTTLSWVAAESAERIMAPLVVEVSEALKQVR